MDNINASRVVDVLVPSRAVKERPGLDARMNVVESECRPDSHLDALAHAGTHEVVPSARAMWPSAILHPARVVRRIPAIFRVRPKVDIVRMPGQVAEWMAGYARVS